MNLFLTTERYFDIQSSRYIRRYIAKKRCTNEIFRKKIYPVNQLTAYRALIANRMDVFEDIMLQIDCNLGTLLENICSTGHTKFIDNFVKEKGLSTTDGRIIRSPISKLIKDNCTSSLYTFACKHLHLGIAKYIGHENKNIQFYSAMTSGNLCLIKQYITEYFEEFVLSIILNCSFRHGPVMIKFMMKLYPNFSVTDRKVYILLQNNLSIIKGYNYSIEERRQYLERHSSYGLTYKN